VLKAAASFDGALRTFKSGSVAHGSVNNPVDDADGGLVLDRWIYVELGPDSAEGQGPEEIVGEVREHVMSIVRETYPNARSRLIKRATLIHFKEPNADGVDPSVDLVVALTRKDADGLWIPNRDKDDWDASHPEQHTRLLTADDKTRRLHRARVIRLAKAAIKGDSAPALISFNVEALALTHITKARTLAESLQLFFDKTASSIKVGLTDDPAGVSGNIKLPDGMTRERSAKRLRRFADKLQEAIDHTDDRPTVESTLAEPYPDQLPDAQRSHQGPARQLDPRSLQTAPRLLAACAASRRRSRRTNTSWASDRSLRASVGRPSCRYQPPHAVGRPRILELVEISRALQRFFERRHRGLGLTEVVQRLPEFVSTRTRCLG
jgi:hypothetical protein